VETLLSPLLPLYERERAADRDLALAVVVHTSGSTYRKPGAFMLIANDASYAGLLSGGCLESDLLERAREVIRTGAACSATYRTGDSEDTLWGLGIGCEGTMQILLLRVGAGNDWQPLAHLKQALRAHRHTAVAFVLESSNTALSAGQVVLPVESSMGTEALNADVEALLRSVLSSGQPSALTAAGLRVFATPLALPPRLLLLGGGPDAAPLVDLAARLAWMVTVYDHRPTYAQHTHFPQAVRVVLAHQDELGSALDLEGFEAAVVMSHHLPSDLIYLRTLARSSIRYIGLLGPAARRERLLSELADDAAGLRGRLHAPVGLPLGGRAPESVALCVVAEIHAHLHGRDRIPVTATP
jgi:xanthine dehydrogenase accessory factor